MRRRRPSRACGRGRAALRRASAALVALGALAALGAAPPRRPAAAVVAVVRVVDRDPAAADGGGYLVAVEQVRHGSPRGALLAVRVPAEDGPGRRLAEAALAGGEPVELTLLPAAEPGADYDTAAVRAAYGPAVSDPTPPPLAAPAAAGARRRAAPLTAGAPYEAQVIELVNEARQANGNLPPLKEASELDTSAGTHSSNMATRDFFAHCDLDFGTHPGDRMTAAGYAWTAAGENIAAGQPTPQDVMDTWLASSGHRANILSVGYREIGVGYVHQGDDQPTVRLDQNGDCTADSFGHGPYFHYWTQNFGQRSGVYPVVIEREAYATQCADVGLYVYAPGGSQEMRFSNDGATWSSWEPYSPVTQWTLDPAASGTATVWAEVRNGTVVQSHDTIELAAGYPAASNVHLQAQTVTGSQSFVACDTLLADDGFTVAAGGDATFTAPHIVLGDGFSVASGGRFTAIAR